MNILHVLSGDFVTGSETSTAAIIDRQVKQGHRVWVAAGKFAHATPAQLISIPIHNRSLFRRFFNVRDLARVIRRQHIDIVHAHSRAASWVSCWACRLTGTAYLSTLHGRQHLHFSNRHFNVYGPRIAAVCENIRGQMLEETGVFRPDQITVIRNGIDLKASRK